MLLLGLKLDETPHTTFSEQKTRHENMSYIWMVGQDRVTNTSGSAPKQIPTRFPGNSTEQRHDLTMY